ncbi:hypothetical protein [Salinibacter ruber]|uniref:hypothetical protein n=1 Tax=Salinibacter ruber TaxID=146919 RepID=UPI002074790E|nr:hypothetical protein [Salinibacter ruber]
MNTSKTDEGSRETGITYDELFGEPALGDSSEEVPKEAPQETAEPERKSPYEVGNPSGSPPDPRPLLGAPRPAREAYERLHPVAYQYASDHFQVMIGVRKALKRAHKAAERAGGLEV